MDFVCWAATTRRTTASAAPAATVPPAHATTENLHQPLGTLPSLDVINWWRSNQKSQGKPIVLKEDEEVRHGGRHRWPATVGYKQQAGNIMVCLKIMCSIYAIWGWQALTYMFVKNWWIFSNDLDHFVIHPFSLRVSVVACHSTRFVSWVVGLLHPLCQF